MGMEYLGTRELAAMLGVDEAEARRLAGSDGFPAPVMALASGPVWELADLERWARATGRATAPPHTSG